MWVQRGLRPASRARPVKIRAGGYRASRQMALRTRSKSTCLRTTSSGSVTLIAPGSHVTSLPVQAMSGMWTVRGVTVRSMSWLTRAARPGIPAPWAADAGSRTSCRRGIPRGAAADRKRRSCSLLCCVRHGDGAERTVVLAPGHGAVSHGRSAPSSDGCYPQAAFARRIRRRRSAERSSSFSPPHVPYFSGRDTA